MKLPILSYGFSELSTECSFITKDYPGLKTLISDMWETMYAANGAGLAAPQVGRYIKLFIVDTVQSYENSDFDKRDLFIGDTGIKEVFINAEIVELSGKSKIGAEGCLSIPDMQFEVERKLSVIMKYYNGDFEERQILFSGSSARAVLHEFDHTKGVLLTDYTDKEKIKDQLDKISAGKIKVSYKMKFPKTKG
jgi:peptide deformylase